MYRSGLLILASLALLLGAAPAGHAQLSISAYSTCAPPDSVYVTWVTHDATGDPSSYPEFVGYDVMRRVLPDCDEYVRANEEIIPRVPGVEHVTHYFQELSPASGGVVEYRIRAVDANRQQVFIPGFCIGPCDTYLNCPALSAPITVGTLVELAPGFVYAVPCPGTCYPAPYFAEGVPPELQPYVGTNATFSFFGTVACGTVEGCVLFVDHWITSTCVTPVMARSWGQLKMIYR